AAADEEGAHRHPAALRHHGVDLVARAVPRRGQDELQPLQALLDAVVPARPGPLPPRAALPGALPLAPAAVDRALDRGGLSEQRRQHLLALPGDRHPAVLRPRLEGATVEPRETVARARPAGVVVPD